MVDDISEARDISGRSEGPTANLTESKTDENLWYVIQKIRQIAAYLLFFSYVGVDLKRNFAMIFLLLFLQGLSVVRSANQ
jgi:hypothetical protein